MAQQKEIQYLGRDYAAMKSQLMEFVQIYFPDDWQDFSENSPSMALLELAAYTGDVLGYYQDNNFNEIFLERAKEFKNIVSAAKNLTYKYRNQRPSYGKIDITCNFGTSANFLNYGFILQRGTQFATNIQPFVVFETLYDIDFSEIDDNTIISSTPDLRNYWVTKRNVDIVSGSTKEYKVSVGTPQKFFKLRLPDLNVFNILSVTDSDNNKFYQVNSLSQDVIMRSVINYSSTSGDVTNNLLLKYVPRRFVPDIDEFGFTTLTFGSGCFALDTKFPLLDGRNLELKQIIQEVNSGKQLWGYSCNPENGEFVPGKITNAVVTGINKQVIKITLDNGKELKVTPDHNFPTWNKGKCEAQNLKIGDSIISFNKRLSEEKKLKNYEQIYDHSLKEWIYTHRKVAKYLKNKIVFEKTFFEENINEEKRIIHHKNINKKDNSPTNLEFVGFKDHWKFHSTIIGVIGPMALAKKRKENPELFKIISEKHSVFMKQYHKNLSNEDKKMIYDKIAKSNSYTKKNNKKVNEKCILNGKKLWENIEFRNKKIEWNTNRWLKNGFREKATKNMSNAKKYKFDSVIEKYIIDAYKNGYNDGYKIADCLNNNNKFKEYFYSLNADSKCRYSKTKHSINRCLVNLALKELGYKGFRDFKKKVSMFNHKVVKIEWMEEKIDVGNLTIDGNHEFHNYHTVALTNGIYAYQCNNVMEFDFIPSPEDYTINPTLVGKVEIPFQNIMVENFMNTSSLGYAPSNTQLTVKYQTGGGKSSNVGIGKVVKLVKSVYIPKNDSNNGQAKMNSIVSSLTSYNREETSGGLESDNFSDIKYIAPKYFATQGRAVSLQDFIAISKSMPENFGSVYRCSAKVSSNYNNTVEMYILSKKENDSIKIFQKPNTALINNLKNYMRNYRAYNDNIIIKPANIIDIGIEYSLRIDSYYSNANEIAVRTLYALKDYFNIANWDIEQPIYLARISNIITNVKGVLAVYNLNVVKKDNGYEGREYNDNPDFDLTKNIQRGTLLCPPNSVFQCRYPLYDINASFETQ